MKRYFLLVVAVILLVVPSVTGQRCLSPEIAFEIKREAFRNSGMEELAEWMTDFLGPRLVASKMGARAENLMKEKFTQMGLSNARIEFARDFPKGGWDNVKTYAAMTAPYYCNFPANPKAWSGSTQGLVRGEVVLIEVKKEGDLDKYKGKLAGKIVLMPVTKEYQLSFEPVATRYTDEELAELSKDPRPKTRRRELQFQTSGTDLLQKVRALLQEEKPAVIVHGAGDFNVPHSLGIGYRYGNPEPVAELVLPVESHGRMARLAAKGIPVEMEVDIRNEFSENLVVNNVIAEIPGTDPKLKNEVVLIGGHLDSWHGGTGASDNASGCMVMMEAMRIIKAAGVQPRRTIRIALWGGEEQGMLGSSGYAANHLYDSKARKCKEEYDKFALYLNMDNGSGRFRGIYLQENDMALPFFEAWMKPVESLGFNTLSPRNTGGTDHGIFDGYGLPSYQFIQDKLDYNRSYHRPTDTYERLVMDDLKYNAAMIAWFALNASMDDARIPVKPMSWNKK